MDSLHFVSGLPRSGSTLLCNILAQNPRFRTGGTSGILDVLFGVRNQWDKLIEFQTMPKPESDAAKLRVLIGILTAYCADITQPVIFDKSRGWLAHMELIEHILGRKAKVLVPVRDLRDVLASFEKLYRNASKSGQVAGEAEKYYQFQTVEGRCDFWAQADQPVGLAYNRIKDALQRGFGDRLHFVKFDVLTKNPRRVMREIYGFLGEDYYEHDFDNVEQVTIENDRLHGFDNLHAIRQNVAPVQPQYPQILGAVAQKYDGLKIW